MIDLVLLPVVQPVVVGILSLAEAPPDRDRTGANNVALKILSRES
jgi:hypothetical protein